MVDVSVDHWTSKSMFAEGFRKWLDDYDELLQRYLDDHVAMEEDWFSLYQKVISDEVLAYFFYMYLSSIHHSMTHGMTDIAHKLAESGSIIMLCGNRGSGKTVFAMSLIAEAKRLHPEKKTVYFGVGDVPPVFDIKTMNWDELPANSIIFIDELGVLQFSRNAMTRDQIDVVQKIPIIRHGGRSFLVISQQASLSDSNWIKALTAIIFLSPAMIALKEDTKISINEQLKYFFPRKKGEYLYLDNDRMMSGMFTVPRFWKEIYSTPFAPFKTKERMYRHVIELLQQNMPTATIMDYLAIRNAHIDETTVEWLRLCMPTDILRWSDEKITNFVEKDSELPLQKV